MQKELTESDLIAQSNISAELKLALSGGKEELSFSKSKFNSTTVGFIWLQLLSLSLFTKFNLNKESLSRQMVVELQRSANESTLIGNQRDPNQIDHNKKSKTKSARLLCLTYHIVSKLDNKASENHTENIEEEIIFKEDIQKTFKQTDGKN